MGKRVQLAQRRKSIGCSQEQLADRLGIDRSTVARWEAGDTEPLPWLRPGLARALQVSLEQLDAYLDEATLTPTSDDDRLAYLASHPDAVDLAAVHELRDSLDSLDRAYETAPSSSLLAETGACLGTVTLLRDHARSTRLRRELLALEADAAIFLGVLIWDASQRRDHAAARHHYRRGADAAGHLGHPAVEALATLRLCYLALYGDTDPGAGLELALTTDAPTRTSSPALATLAALHAAEAHAMLGHPDDCDRSLQEADGHVERITPDDSAHDLFAATDPGRLAGSCYLSLGRHHRAETVLADTAGQMRSTAKSRAIVLGNLAMARTQQHDLDGAVTALHEAIDILQLTWGGGGIAVVFSAARQLRPWTHAPAVADVRERLLTLLAAG